MSFHHEEAHRHPPGHNFALDGINLPTRKLFSIGQALRSRYFRRLYASATGDYHDLLGLEGTLRDFDIVHSAETA